jgi:hypothetical protein
MIMPRADRFITTPDICPRHASKPVVGNVAQTGRGRMSDADMQA